jgi:hypothetical protein
MDFLLPLTVIGFIISIYQISEESKKRNFIFKISSVDKVFLGFFAVILIFSIFAANFWSNQVSGNHINISATGSLFAYDMGATNDYKITYSFLFSIIAFTVSVILILFTREKLNSTRLKQKKDFVVNSLDNLGRQKYAEIAADLELFHCDLLRSYKPPKVKTHYICTYFAEIEQVIRKNIGFKSIKTPQSTFNKIKKEIGTYKDSKKRRKDHFDFFGPSLSIFRYEQNATFVQRTCHQLDFTRNKKLAHCNFIDDYYGELMSNHNFLEYVAMNNTDLMLLFLDNKLSSDKEEIWAIIGTKLISDETSKLHKELVVTENRQRKIIDFLFNDVNKCGQWLVWRPIGEYIIQHLKEQCSKNTDEYNLYEGYYTEGKRNNTRLYSGIKFFEIMINRALEQNIQDHMWLMYFEYWVEHILDNINFVDKKNVEYSSLYEYYLFLIVRNIRYWIAYAKKDASTQNNKVIINAAICTIVGIMEKISSSSVLRNTFKNNLRSIMIENYFELAAYNDQEKTAQYVEKYKECIEDKVGVYSEVNQSFIEFLKYPVEHYHDRTFWDRGIHYSDKLRNDFIQFLDSLSQENA